MKWDCIDQSEEKTIIFNCSNLTGLKVALALLSVCLLAMATVNTVIKYDQDQLRKIGQ